MRKTYNRIISELKTGETTIRELRREYSKSRSIAQKRIGRIEKSDVPFTNLNAKPDFLKLKDIKDQDIVKALSDLNKFLESDYSTLKGRHKRRDDFIKEVNRGREKPLVTKENYYTYLNFMEWFRDNNLNKIFGSKDDVVEEFFEEHWESLETADVSDWMDIFVMNYF